jgi:hypothetical protein
MFYFLQIRHGRNRTLPPVMGEALRPAIVVSKDQIAHGAEVKGCLIRLIS